MTNNVMLMDVPWRINKAGGVKKKEQFFSLQEPYQIAAFYLRTGCCGAAAAENVYL